MPMPYYIFPNAFSEPKAGRGDATSAPESLLHIRTIRTLLHIRGLQHCPVRPQPGPSGFISDTEAPLS